MVGVSVTITVVGYDFGQSASTAENEPVLPPSRGYTRLSALVTLKLAVTTGGLMKASVREPHGWRKATPTASQHSIFTKKAFSLTLTVWLDGPGQSGCLHPCTAQHTVHTSTLNTMQPRTIHSQQLH